MNSVPLLQTASAVATNASFAWLIGSWLARRWLQSCGVIGGREDGTLRRFDLLAASLCICASLCELWAGTAVMGGTGLLDALGSIRLLTTTDYGRAGAVSIIVLILVLALRVFCTRQHAREFGVIGGLAVFVLVRASMGHAGENGWWSVAMAVEAVHLASIGIWAGLVFVSGWLVVGSTTLHLTPAMSGNYLGRMSQAATGAVAVILLTGSYNAWQRIGTLGNLTQGSYANAFLVKIGLVAVALLLGGYNKFIGLQQANDSYKGVQGVRRLLQYESIVLLGVLTAAATMISQQPPTAM